MQQALTTLRRVYEAISREAGSEIAAAKPPVVMLSRDLHRTIRRETFHQNRIGIVAQFHEDETICGCEYLINSHPDAPALSICREVKL